MDVFSLAPVIAAPAEPVKPSRRKKPEISKEEKDAKRTTKEVQNNVHQFNRLIDRQINIIEQLNGINERTQIALAEVEAAAKDDKKLLHLVFKGCAEIRSQLEFAADLMKMLYDSQAVQEYQEEVLEVIGSVDMNVRREIERRLAERRALRGAVQLPGAPGGIGPGE
jgi:hypothetical protein